MIDLETIGKALKLLRHAAPHATVIVSGSYARGNATDESDLDLLVVEPGPVARRFESARLRSVLGVFEIPVDIIVITEQIFEEWKMTPGMIALEPAQPSRPYPVVHFGLGIWRLLARQRAASGLTHHLQ